MYNRKGFKYWSISELNYLESQSLCCRVNHDPKKTLIKQANNMDINGQ